MLKSLKRAARRRALRKAEKELPALIAAGLDLDRVWNETTRERTGVERKPDEPLREYVARATGLTCAQLDRAFALMLEGYEPHEAEDIARKG